MKTAALLTILLANFSAWAECGNKFVFDVKVEKDGKLSFEDGDYIKEQFCDPGKNEANANYEVVLKSKAGESQKNVFINDFVFSESSDKEGKLKLQKLSSTGVYRQIKMQTPPGSEEEMNLVISDKAGKVRLSKKLNLAKFLFAPKN